MIPRSKPRGNQPRALLELSLRRSVVDRVQGACTRTAGIVHQSQAARAERARVIVGRGTVVRYMRGGAIQMLFVTGERRADQGPSRLARRLREAFGASDSAGGACASTHPTPVRIRKPLSPCAYTGPSRAHGISLIMRYSFHTRHGREGQGGTRTWFTGG